MEILQDVVLILTGVMIGIFCSIIIFDLNKKSE